MSELNPVRILAIGDLHIQPNNLVEINVFLIQLAKYLETVDLDLIVIMGDTLHTHETVYTECLNKMLEYVTLCEGHAETMILVGNHDYVNNQAFLDDSHPFVAWRKTHQIVDRVIAREIRGNVLTFCPYVPDGRFLEALETCKLQERGWIGHTGTERVEVLPTDDELSRVNDASTSKPPHPGVACVFAHQLLDGAKMGPIVASGVEKWPDNAPMVISGHIHDKQLPQRNLWYTGSAMQVSFGDTPDHTISLITLSNSSGEAKDDESKFDPCAGIHIQEIDICPPAKKTIYCDVSEIRDLVLPRRENLRLKLSITGDPIAFGTFKRSERYRQLLTEGIKMVFKHQKNAEPVRGVERGPVKVRRFQDVLHDRICTSQDPGLMKVYTKLTGNPCVALTDVVFE